tara:strand:+ start:835 stop:1035 length:201 start_codon:yes stop_codon:yes gene_type:complete
MSEIDKQLSEELNNNISQLEEFLENLSKDINDFEIDKNNVDSLKSLLDNLKSNISKLDYPVHDEEE